MKTGVIGAKKFHSGKKVILNCNISQYECFNCIFDQTNAAYV